MIVRDCLSLGIVAALVSAVHAAPVTNGGFEDGVADWPAFATAGATGKFVVEPPEGVSQLIISSAGTNDFAGMDAFLKVPAGTTLSTFTRETLLPASFVNRGNVVGRSITANAGDTLSFMWCHLTEEVFERRGDFSVFQIARADGSVLTNGLLGYNLRYGEFVEVNLPTETSIRARTAYRTFTYTFAEAGTFQFGLGVFDIQQPTLPSYLLVDSVSLVPEPTMLAAFGIAGVGLLRRRR